MAVQPLLIRIGHDQFGSLANFEASVIYAAFSGKGWPVKRS